ncbi:MAG: deoxyribodipyrimidine photo-lyase [Saprospiraceae bacterium]|nr:deoxyribodipyrimidine photo-lyase [Saprospiraceae bacterium]
MFWFRRDLRLHDNAGLYHALKNNRAVVGMFIFDSNILDQLEDKDDARVTFLYDRLMELQKQMHEFGGNLLIFNGRPLDIVTFLADRWPLAAVHANRDIEPYSRERDLEITDWLGKRGIPLHLYKDHWVIEWDELVKKDGTPYTVFTPYAKAWMARLKDTSANGHPETSSFLSVWPSEDQRAGWMKVANTTAPTLEQMGFRRSRKSFPSDTVSSRLVREYANSRDYPARNGTSRLGIHFRFGTISIREKVRKALRLSDVYVNELIWREFYAQILAHFPHVAQQAFKPAYDRIPWRDDEEDFHKWCRGLTGYPLVDAGMRELMATGYMHNRVRMVTASFLTKHLLIDWRWGESWFARHLLDYEMASNNGGWQWAAGCGTDAAPYFRIFNPELQRRKFDPDGSYIRKWVPEWDSPRYPASMIPHELARDRCLKVYRAALRAEHQ